MKSDWQEWIEKIENKEVTEEELRDFRAALERDPEQMDGYLEALLLETSLDLQGGLNRPERESEGGAARWLKGYWVPLGLAAALAVGYFLPNPVEELEPEVVVVATITDTNEVADGVGLKIGQGLEARRLSIPEGAQLGIAMRAGARLHINGPAEFELVDAQRIALKKGRVQTYAPTYAHGFTIDTDDGKVVDLGTKFVTSTGTSIGTEVHVNEGLVEAEVKGGMQRLSEGQAGILKDGALVKTDFLAHRLEVPLDPILPDSDGDGVSDVIELHYGKDPHDANDTPRLLRMEESFVGYAEGERKDEPYQGYGKIERWAGRGIFRDEGLGYVQGEERLLSKGGGFQTMGVGHVGNALDLPEGFLPSEGVVYLSFLMQQREPKSGGAFGGLILYEGAYKERLFVGDLSPYDAYGSRYNEEAKQDSFEVPSDSAVHLFVVRIDQTRKLTDIFIDPDLSVEEEDMEPVMRYQGAPPFSRITLRSGNGGIHRVDFDEIRVGLSWRSVLPLER
ncbi:FecR domain-containing protein [Rubritalea tangerina]|uniref:FecR domain-containing protein n=1 Tax=Rubritalea tangerina TaxID=430798 RepID=A0ABW4ZF22_9BACT